MTNVTIASSLPPGTTRTGRFVMVLLLASACLGHAQLAAQTIEGVLLESGTDRPIELGLITLLTVDSDSVGSALTDEAGRFRVESPSGGEFLLSASALGYRPTVASSVFTIEDGGAMSLQFRIEPLAMQLEGITVEAEASLFMQPKLVQNGFVERAQRGFGRFITPRDIELAHALTTGDLLARTGRVTTRPAFGGDQVLMLGPVATAHRACIWMGFASPWTSPSRPSRPCRCSKPLKYTGPPRRPQPSTEEAWGAAGLSCSGRRPGE